MIIFIFLLLATYFSAFVLGATQFYMLEKMLTWYGADSRDWLIQAIAAAMTAGPVLVYFVSGPLAAAFKKRYVMGISVWLAAVVLVFGGYLGWPFSPWLYLIMIGLLLGIFNAGKMASVPLISGMLKKTTTTVNAGMSILFVVGLLTGYPMGTKLFKDYPKKGYLIAAGLLFITGLFALLCRYTKERTKPFITEQKHIVSETGYLFKRHALFLLMGPILWGVAGAANLAIAALVVREGIGKEMQAAFIPLWAAVGAIAGNLISPLFYRMRFIFASLFTFLMAILLLFIPALAVSYPVVIIGAVILGLLFGAATNLNDSTFLERVGEEGREGTGAALQSAMLAVCSVSAAVLITFALIYKLILPNTAFLIFAFLTLVSTSLALIMSFRYGKGVEVLMTLVSYVTQWVLALRYDITFNGLEQITENEGLLILPNHPAEMDPVVLVVRLWRRLQPRVIVLEDFFHMPVLKNLFAMLRALPMPNMESGKSQFKLRRLDKTLEAVVQNLQAGDNVILYPSGRLSRDGREIIGGASATHTVLQAIPDAKILLVHTTGLWGSSFSWAYKNQRPDLAAQLLHGIKVILLNGIFFVKRRKITVTVRLAGEDFPRGAGRGILNQWLEDWHASFGKEELSLVPYNRFSGKVPKVAGGETVKQIDISDVPQQIRAGVLEEFARMCKTTPEELTPEMMIREDLGFDSLELADIMSWLDTRFNVTDVGIPDITTIGSVMVIAAGGVDRAEDTPAARTPEAWLGAHPEPHMYDAQTIIECFLRNADRMGSAVACGDEMSGVLSWKRMKIGVLLFADIIKTMPGERIGIMLASLAVTDILLMATMLAGKVPVMINWTLGELNLQHVIKTADIQVILTSRRFADNLDNVAFDEIEDLLIFLEDLGSERIGLKAKIGAILRARKSAEAHMRHYRLNGVKGEDTAVILFTSGSEAAPKGVPLTHNNILSNVRAIQSIFKLTKEDVIYSFLPPFHSFGLTTTTILPLMLGLRVAHYPNPTEARKLADGIATWKATLMAGTPTFLEAIIKAAQPGQLDSMKLMATGAEKAPAELFDKVKKLGTGAYLLEGYGITECSPVVSACRPCEVPVGVGKPLSGVEIIIIDLEGHQPLKQGERGLILVHGPNVFKGYLGENPPNPFMELEGKRWYNTGDLGYIAEDGSIVISGRLKRFVKIGGEMLSLPAMEVALSDKWPPGDEGPVVAVEAVEREGERAIMCMFTSQSISIEEANAVLREAGFSNIARIKRVEKVNAIPLLGTGKTDYQTLKKKLAEMTEQN